MHNITETTSSIVPDGAILLHCANGSYVRYGFIQKDAMLVVTKKAVGWDWKIQRHDPNDEDDMPTISSSSFFTTLDECLIDALSHIDEVRQAS